MNGLGTFADLLSFFILTIVAISLVGVLIFTWLLFITLFHTVIKKRNCRMGLRTKRVLRYIFLASGWTFFGLFIFFLVLTFGGTLFTGTYIAHLAFPVVTLLIIYWLNIIFPLFVNCRCSECKCHCGCGGSKRKKFKAHNKPETQNNNINPVQNNPMPYQNHQQERNNQQKEKHYKNKFNKHQKNERIPEKTKHEHPGQLSRDSSIKDSAIIPRMQEKSIPTPIEPTQQEEFIKVTPINDGSVKERFERAEKQQTTQSFDIPPVAPMFTDNNTSRRTQSIVHTQTPSIIAMQEEQKNMPQTQKLKAITKEEESGKTQTKTQEAQIPSASNTSQITQLSPTHTVEVQTNQTIERSTNVQSSQLINKREATLFSDGTITGQASQSITNSTTQMNSETEGLKAQYDKLERQLDQMRDNKPKQIVSSAPTSQTSTQIRTAQYSSKYGETDVNDALSGLRSAMNELQRQIDSKN